MEIRAVIPKQKTQEIAVFQTSLFSNEDKLILAPLQNLTSLFFRRTFAHFFPNNFDFAVSPFISATTDGQNIDSVLYKDIQLRANAGLIPLVPQILGGNPERILQCATIIERLGYREINLNMGCPKKDIVKRQRGAGLLKNVDSVRQIIETVFKNTKLQLSIKVRLGINDDTELRILVPILNMYPLQSVIIHPRTQSQQYDGHPALDKFEFFASELKHTIVYNGDIFSVEDFARLKSRFPYIKHWMIGRGILMNPFLCADIRGIPYNKHEMSAPYLYELQQNFIQSLNVYNENTVLGKMKEIVKYLAVGYNFDATPLLRESSLSEFNKKFDAVIHSVSV